MSPVPADVATIRQMQRDELDKAVSWARDEGWNPGLHDAAAFWNCDPSGFWALELDGKMIGSLSAVSYANRFGFIGFFIVQPAYRGRGHGSRLWNAVRRNLEQRLVPGAAIGLDGVFAMQDSYAKDGFVFSHRNVRMEGIGQIGEVPDNVVAVGSGDIVHLQEIDRRCFGFDRASFLKDWLSMPESRVLRTISNGRTTGYGCVRRCGKGFKIGPLFADGADEAEALFCGLRAAAVGESIYLDVPENNKLATELARRHNLKESFGCARMYRGNFPMLPYDQIYGVTSFELG